MAKGSTSVRSPHPGLHVAGSRTVRRPTSHQIGNRNGTYNPQWTNPKATLPANAAVTPKGGRR